MKTVFSNSEIMHVFAGQTQDFGKTTNRSIFFERGKIYSYGYHFCMANLVGNNLFFTLRSYSNTTEKHISKLESATRQYNKIYCAYPDGSKDENFRFWKNEAEKEASKLLKAKKPQIYLNELSNIQEQVSKYCEAMQFLIPDELIEILSIQNKDEFKILAEKAAAKEIENIKKKEYKNKLQFKENFKKWTNFEIDYLHTKNLDFLRLKDEKIQTTQQVQIPINLAIKLYNSIKDNTLKIGDKLLNYEVRNIDKKTISIGCHNFNKFYLLKFGSKLVN
jgi:hypothetical protein